MLPKDQVLTRGLIAEIGVRHAARLLLNGRGPKGKERSHNLDDPHEARRELIQRTAHAILIVHSSCGTN